MVFMPPFGPPPGPSPGSPFGPPLGPPQGPPQGQGQQGPSSPPPQITPQKPAASAFAVDPGAIARCLFRNTYIWLSNGQQFWYYPIFVGRTSIAGYRWNGRFWMYSGFDLRLIESFTCF